MGDYSAPKDYVEVKDRLIEFRAKHPEGYLAIKEVRIVNVPASFLPGKTLKNGRQTPDQITPPQSYLLVIAQAFRAPGDDDPAEGIAWEPIPGRTPYTKDSEAQNAETSAWGRALIALGAADARTGIPSQNEVRNRTYTRDDWDGDTWENAAPAPAPTTAPAPPGRAARSKRTADEDTPWNTPAPDGPANDHANDHANGHATDNPALYLKTCAARANALTATDIDDAATLTLKVTALRALHAELLGAAKAGRIDHHAASPLLQEITAEGRSINALLGVTP